MIEESELITIHPFYSKLLKQFLRKYYQDQFVPKYATEIIKNLLQELQPGDEITLDQAIQVIQQESLPHKPKEVFIRDFLKSIGA